MPERLTPDICVIGGGSGGLSVAAAAAAFGVPVVLIEKGKMGGDCLNYGCVPSKALLAVARQVAAIDKVSEFGVAVQRSKVNFLAVRNRVHAVIAAIAPNDSKERFTGLGVRVIEGTARFTDNNTVVVNNSEITARRFVIATGSSPAIPPIAGLAATPYLTNDTIFDLAACPEHLAVIGAGPIGLELAQAFRRLGAGVTVLEAAVPLGKDDPECAARVLDSLAREGVAIRPGVAIASIHRHNGKVAVSVEAGAQTETIEASHVLVAAGRRPNIDDLDLDAAGIAHDRRGITVDRGLRTSNRRVYAIGDVSGAPQFTHVANYHAGLVIRNALIRLPVRTNDNAIPSVTYTDPELAHVGLTEADARGRGYGFNVLRWPYHDNDRAQTERTTCGHIKIVTTRRGRILGATIVGAQAGELIATWALAISHGMNIRTVAGTVFPYPTLSEIGKRAAITYFTPGLTNPMLRCIIGALRRLG